MPSNTPTGRFEHFNLKYRLLQRTDAYEDEETQLAAKAFDSWGIEVQSWPTHYISTAVYGIPDETNVSRGTVEQWQRFRVSMKGQSTQMKLCRLNALYMEQCYRREAQVDWSVWKCRIDNYIGALVRGGMLEARTFKVLR